MIRVIRHASRTGFSIDDQPTGPSFDIGSNTTMFPSRIRDEFLRDLKEGVVQPSFGLMLETDLLLSLFPDFQRVFGDRSPEKERNRQLFLSLFGLADQLMNRDRFVPEPVHLALLLTPFIQAITPEHPFLGEKERYLYRMQTIDWPPPDSCSFLIS